MCVRVRACVCALALTVNCAYASHFPAPQLNFCCKFMQMHCSSNAKCVAFPSLPSQIPHIAPAFYVNATPSLLAPGLTSCHRAIVHSQAG